MSVAIRHHVPGRTRLGLERWPAAPALERLGRGLAANGCELASSSAATGSLLLRHATSLSAGAAAQLVGRLLSAPEEEGGALAEIATPAVETICEADAQEATALLQSSPEGLEPEEARRRLAAHGPNALPTPHGRSRGDIATSQFKSFPVALLAGSAVLSLATGGLIDAVVTIGVVLVNAGIGYSSEDATERLIRRLSQPVEHTATVIRNGAATVVPAREVVPGDVLALEPGMFVPADARVIEAHGLSIDQSVLTGESLPMEKTGEPLSPAPAAVSDRRNIVHGGTVVTGGNGRAIVFRTGRQTESGRTRELIGTARRPRPVIASRLDALESRLVIGCLAVSGLVFAIGLMRGEPLVQMIKSAAALAVSAIPEGLPAVATTTLSLGAKAMEGERAFVRALPAVEAVGTIDTICLDKTGTLTENRMAVVAAHVDGETREIGPGERWEASESASLRALAEAVALCNEARLSSNAGSSTEIALLRFAAEVGVDPDAIQDRSPVLGMRSRNPTRRWMATEHHHNGERYVAVKGAPDEIVRLSSHVRAGNELRAVDEAWREGILEQNHELASRGLRVLGVGRRLGNGSLHEMGDLAFLGLVALADPVRAEARQAVDILHRAGVRTIILTGDQPATAQAVARSLAISRTGIINVADGPELASLDDGELGALALRTSVFARVSPAEKLRIVRALQGAGRRVAMIGDGVNDGPALRAATVGVAMGRNCTEVAREVADIVVADDDLRELARAIARGRATEDNVRAAIRYFLSTNLSEVLVMLVESLHGRGELETPMELFWLNLVTDIMPALGLALAEPRGDVMARPPRPADAALFDTGEYRDMGLDGATITAAALVAHFITLARAGPGPRARGATFLTLAMAQIAQAWVLRDRSPQAGDALIVSERRLEAMLAVAGVLLALPFVFPPLRRLLGIAPLTFGDFLLSASLAGAAFGTSETRRIIVSASGRDAPSPGSPPDRTG